MSNEEIVVDDVFDEEDDGEPERIGIAPIDAPDTFLVPTIADSQAHPPSVSFAPEVYGKYIQRSKICPICLRRDHMDINYMRSRDHMTCHDIALARQASIDSLELHFRKHFVIAKHHQDILDLQENSSQESNEIITRIIEGEMDFFGGAQAVMNSKAQRLHPIHERIKSLADRYEIDDLEDVEKQEFMLLNKLAEEVENSIMKIQTAVDKKYIPNTKEELARAMVSYKLSVLTKFVDDIVLVLIEFERIPEYRELVRQIRNTLSQRVSALEASILRSGGMLQPLDSATES